MKDLNICISKECIIRTLRTFLQTAIGYVLANVSLHLGGIDFTDDNILKNALAGLAVSAFSAGAAAVMNLKKGEDKNNG